MKLIFAFCLTTDPPEITKKPTNQGVRVGGVASFFCAARGDPQPTIVWRKNGKKVSSTYHITTTKRMRMMTTTAARHNVNVLRPFIITTLMMIVMN